MMRFKHFCSVTFLSFAFQTNEAQTVSWVCSTDGQFIQNKSTKISKKPSQQPLLEIDEVMLNDQKTGMKFLDWGITFNELDWDALNLLDENERQQILKNVFAADGQLKVTRGRIGMNANDYARSWFSCDEVPGDFKLKYFNIERDKQAIIPFIHAAQKYCPQLTCWTSPWSPPSWMKINQDYAVQSNKYNTLDPKKDWLLFEDSKVQENPDKNIFPKRLAVNDYFIQDPRYLQAYANYFCRFIEEYAKEGIRIDRVMYQNEAWSYTAYPGCPWTPKGIIRFNVEYLAPTLKRLHPDVEVFFGTINTNRYDFIREVMDNPEMRKSVQGMAFQWEGGQIMQRLHEDYPEMRLVSSESECGWGSFDWKSAEHTFDLMNHYLGVGCEEYNIWNLILADDGMSTWGWKQNALIRVDSKNKTFRYCPEYYAMMHYSNFITKGTRIIKHLPASVDKTPVLFAIDKDGKRIVIAGNFNDAEKNITVKIGNRFLNANLPPHSFHSFTF
jgi:glucosylceramidase